MRLAMLASNTNRSEHRERYVDPAHRLCDMTWLDEKALVWAVSKRWQGNPEWKVNYQG